jgi:putative ABC transport system permease protein
MIKNYFKIAWRNIIRHKIYSVINIAGLTVGIAACLLIFTIIRYELSFDIFQPNYKNIYHIVTEQKSESGIDYNPGVAVPATEALRLEFPKAKVASINSSYGSQITVNDGSDLKYNGGKKFTENIGVVFIEPQFFDIFSWKWLAGNAAVLANPNMVVLDKTTATKYFGNWTKAVGKSITMDNLVNLKVAGIIEDAPSNSDLPLKVLISHITWKNYASVYNYSEGWGLLSSSHQIFMLFPDHTTQNDIDKQLKRVTIKYYKSGLKDHLIITTNATLRTLSFIAILIIIMASINFINLSTAQSVGRSKEVGIRKVLGSSRKQLAIQVIGETALIVIGAVILATIVAKISLPYLKNIASVPDDISLINGGSIIFLTLTTLVVIILSGIYPALIVSGFKPVLALKNKITAASIGGISLRRTLVITQFAISQLLIIGTIVAVNQMDFVNKADLGFNKNAVLMLPGYTDSISLKKMQSFKQQLLQNPAVQSVSFTSDAPSSDNNSASNFYFNHSEKEIGFSTFMKIGDADYFKTFGLRFTAGTGYDVSDTMRQVVVNQTLLRKLGIQHDDYAVGKTLRMGTGVWATITGVVEDFKTNSLREAVKPIIIFPSKKYESLAAVKLKSNNLVKTVAGIQSLWENTYPEYAYNGFFLDENIAKFYKQENQMALVYKIFAFIAIFISCLGLYGLVSFMAIQRTKEVGVRKVLGASVSSIVYLFSKEFMALILISCLIAIPAAYYIMNGWLQHFAYRVSLNIWVFVAAIAVSVVIAWLTVGYKAMKAALVNPVKSLKSE